MWSVLGRTSSKPLRSSSICGDEHKTTTQIRPARIEEYPDLAFVSPDSSPTLVAPHVAIQLSISVAPLEQGPP